MSVWLVGGTTSKIGQAFSRKIAAQSTPIAFATELQKSDSDTTLKEKDWLKLASRIVETSDDGAVFTTPLSLESYEALVAAPGINLLFCFLSPAQVIGQAIEQGLSRDEIEDELACWTQHIKQLIELQKNNSRVVHLLCLEAVAQTPEVVNSDIASLNPALAVNAELAPPSAQATLLYHVFNQYNQELATSYLNALEQSISRAPDSTNSNLLDVAINLATTTVGSEAYGELAAQVDEQQLLIEILQSENKALADDHAKKAEVSLAPLKDELSTLREQIDVLSSYNKELKHKLLLRDAEVDKLQLTVEPIKEYCDQLEEQCSDYEAEIDRLSTNLEALENTAESAEELRDELKILTNTNRSLEERLIHIEDESQKQIEAVQSQLNEAQQREHDLTTLNHVMHSQLQQLLEDTESATGNTTMTESIIIPKATQKATSSTIEVIGQYVENGYEDIKLSLHNFTLADGRHFSQIEFKLIKSSDCLGIELRPTDVNGNVANFNEEFSDEHGLYIRFFPAANESLYAAQQRTQEKLNASDRLLVLSLLNHAADALCFGDMRSGISMEDTVLANWKMAARELQNQTAELPTWLATDQVNCIEHYESDGYQHTWIGFNKLLIDDRLYQHYELKFITKGSLNELSEAEVGVELREFNGSVAPLEYWPTGQQDEWGAKLYIGANSDANSFSVDVPLTSHDRKLLREITKNFTNWMGLVATQQELPYSFDTYQKVGEIYETLSAGFKQQQSTESEQIEAHASTDEPSPLYNTLLDRFSFTEALKLGSYEHVVLSTHVNEQPITVKIQAFDVDEEANTCRFALEFRGETEANLPLANSVFFDVDEWGPRAQVALNNAQSINELIDHASQLSAAEKAVVSDAIEQFKRLPDFGDISNTVWQASIERIAN